MKQPKAEIDKRYEDKHKEKLRWKENILLKDVRLRNNSELMSEQRYLKQQADVFQSDESV